jgi:hypothetical protein
VKKLFGRDISDIVPEELLEHYNKFLKTRYLYPKMLEFIAMVNNMKPYQLVKNLTDNGFVKRVMQIKRFN